MFWFFHFISIFILSQSLDARFLKGACPTIKSNEFCGLNGECVKAPHQNNEPAHWCRCDEGYGGMECDKKCDLQCSSNQKCIFDFAQRQTCVCNDCDQFNQTIVNCPRGSGGEKCAKKGFCYPNLCVNGGKCIGDGDDAKCICPTGLTGTFCHIDINECIENPCLNGKCINLFGSYECNCDSGFLPPRCFELGNIWNYPVKKSEICIVHITNDDINRLEKIDGRCKNGGICERMTGNQTKCVCPPGFEGELCEKDINECLLNPCQNRATCRNYEGSFECHCMTGFKGELCEINEDDCIDNKCENGSKCIDEIGRYSCECKNGTMGELCDMIDPCATDPQICSSHGKCTSIPDTGDFNCLCDKGFTGQLCEIDIDECNSFNMNPCYHGGSCINTRGSWKCHCPYGYNGTQCENLVDTCESEQIKCQNGGACFVGRDRDPICQCAQGYIGKRCEISCPSGYGGVRCDLDLNVPVCGTGIGQCANNGKCLNGKCQCSIYYTGNHCEITREEAKAYAAEKSCKDDPCLNNATCIDVVDKFGHVCLCQQGFEGNLCEKRKDFCFSNPCFNGGKCVGGFMGYQCECPQGFDGDKCEKIVKFECDGSGCLNGGKCMNDPIRNEAKCECLYGFAGPRCEQKLDVKSFQNKDLVFQDMCRKKNCSQRANDGNCDLECNFGACDFDGGDCSGKQLPFAKCRYGNMCADLFSNGICDQACNNEDCLYDGMDCMPKVARCPTLIRERCASRYANGICDIECNSEGCGYDGGDCIHHNDDDDDDDDDDNRKEKKTILSDIRLKILMSPRKFEMIGGQILMNISSSLRSIIRIQRDDEGPLVFEWNEVGNKNGGGNYEGRRLDMNVKELEDGHMLVDRKRRGKQIVKRSLQKQQTNREGVMVWLEVETENKDAKSCSIDKSSCLFSNSQSVVDYLSAEIAKKDKTEIGIPIYEAMVAKPSSRHGSTWTMSQVLLIVIIGFVVLGTTVAGVIALNGGDEGRSRKRKIISAPVWMPPTESEMMDKTRKSHALSASSQNSLLGNGHTHGHHGGIGGINDYYDINIKRKKMETTGYGDQQLYQQNTSIGQVAQFSADFGGYGDNQQQQQQQHSLNSSNQIQHLSSSIWSTIHMEAAGNGHISTEINEENVNEQDGKNKRTILHWLAANSTGKKEEIIIEEARKCISVGANVNARDIDENTPLMLAVKMRRLRLANILMIAGANPTNFNKSERSALHEAAVNLDLKMMKLLLKDKRMLQEIDELDRNGRTALMEVAGLDQETEIADFLIKNGAKIDADGATRKDSEVYKGRTALHYASHYGNVEMVKFLVSSNANKDKQDENGQTPIMLAAKEGRRDTVLLLIEKGASLETVDLMEQSARQLAMNQHHKDIVAIIDRAVRDREIAETTMRQMHMLNGKNGKSGGRTTVKAVKKSANRKDYSVCSNSSRDSTLHMTPPPSDGSMSSPSPQHYIHASRIMTPTNLHYTAVTSPLSQHGGPQSINNGNNSTTMYMNPQSNASSISGIGSGTSSGIGSDSSPEYHPQDSDMSYNNSLWYGNNIPYQTMTQTAQGGGYAGMYEHQPLHQHNHYSDRNVQSAFY